MIKILFFIETLEGGGAQIVLRDLVNNMDQTRFDITVQTVWPCDYEKYLIKGIRYKSMYSCRSSINHMRYRIEAATGLAYKLHIKNDYDIECAYLEAGSTKVVSGSTNDKAVKLAWVHCDLKKAVSDPKAYAERTANIYKKFDKVVCVSETIQEAVNEMFGDMVKTCVVYNTIDDKTIRTKAAEDISGEVSHDKATVIAVGTIYPPKNHMRLLKAHKRIADEGIEHDLWLLGDGVDRVKLEEYVQENSLQSSVNLLGFKENPYPYIREADILVSSSNYEGFSTVITEGLILEKPIVTTECSGTREQLGDSEYGIITDNDDDAFYEGLKKMLTDDEIRKHYGHKAAERGSQFTTSALVSATEDFFVNEIMGTHDFDSLEDL